MSCDCDALGCDTLANKLISFEEARQRLLDSAILITETEQCELSQLVGRIAAEPVISSLDIPPYDNSAMDGYALKLAEGKTNFSQGEQFEILDTIFAGHPSKVELSAGTCARIMTGAPIPQGADAVIMQEQVSTSDSHISINNPVSLNSNIRPKGEDVGKDQVIFPAGHCFQIRDIGLLATIGIGSLSVYRKLRVAFFSTGDELVQVGTPLATGQIYDSNRPLLKAMLDSLPVDQIDFGTVKDDPNHLRDVLTKASEQADVIISSAGVSVGDADHVKDILEELGHIGFWKVAMKPGKPFAFGRIGKAQFMGLPGNPVSVAITGEQMAIPYLKKCMRHQEPTAPTLTATLLTSYSRKAGRKEFLRGIAECDAQGHWQVRPVNQQGSGMLNGLAQANCHLIMEADCDHIEAGETVLIILYQHL